MIKLLLIVSLCGHVIGQATPAWKNLVLSTHNTARARFGARPLTWSDALYPGALQWANQCQFRSSNANGKYGEILYASGDPNTSIKEAVNSWMSEYTKYNYNNPVFSPATGHFTQVVWKSTTQVACAIASCRADTIFSMPSKFVLCRYSPPGNFQGQFPQNVGRPV